MPPREGSTPSTKCVPWAHVQGKHDVGLSVSCMVCWMEHASIRTSFPVRIGKKAHGKNQQTVVHTGAGEGGWQRLLYPVNCTAWLPVSVKCHHWAGLQVHQVHHLLTAGQTRHVRCAAVNALERRTERPGTAAANVTSPSALATFTPCVVTVRCAVGWKVCVWHFCPNNAYQLSLYLWKKVNEKMLHKI